MKYKFTEMDIGKICMVKDLNNVFRKRWTIGNFCFIIYGLERDYLHIGPNNSDIIFKVKKDRVFLL